MSRALPCSTDAQSQGTRINNASGCCSVYYVHRALNGRYFTWLPGAHVKCWMLLSLYTLPQLAVSAKILCLLMVVISGAVPSMVRSGRLYSQCSHGYLKIYPNGTVMAKGNDDREQYQNLTMITEDLDLKMLIFAPEVRRFLCYNKRWKLIGEPISKRQALGRPRCQFYENMPDAYNTYHSVAERGHYMAFNQHGQQPGLRRAAAPAMRRCRSFLKIAWDFSIAEHNSRVGGTGAEPRRRAPHKRHERLRHARSRHPRKKRPRDGAA